MPKHFKEIMKTVHDQENVIRVENDRTRFKLYNGQLRDVIKAAISKEFEDPETVKDLSNRIIPINITQKIINKLAGLYIEPATRTDLNKNPTDLELISLYEESLMIDQKMKGANRYFKLHKHVALEPFLDYKGVPRMRFLTSPSYTVISDDLMQPDRMTTFIKHIRLTNDKKSDRFSLWTDKEFWIIDGEGSVVVDEMIKLDNPDGINPFGVIPFTYIAESDDNNLIPISDDDLVHMQIAICLLLTDIAFASKYQLWSVLAVTGADQNAKIPFNPNSIITLPAGADIKVIKPEVDSDKALRMVEAMLGMLLTTKNLSVNEVSTDLKSTTAASGISKILDRAESTEDRKDQMEYFRNGEKEFWDKYANNILPYWVESKKIHKDFVGAFSDQFDFGIEFSEPKPFAGDKEKVELQIMKLENGLISKKDALKAINPNLDDEEAIEALASIQKEKLENVKFIQKNFPDQNSPSKDKKEDKDNKEDKDI